MRVDAFDFDLPADRIALRPAEPRDFARLLVVEPGSDAERPLLRDHQVADLAGLLRRGDLLIFNDTRVIPAQLVGRRMRGESALPVSVTLLERIDDAAWWAFARPGRRLREGDIVRFAPDGESCSAGALEATVDEKRDDGRVRFAFSLHGPFLDDAIRTLGAPPLPPYIAARRRADARDRSDYQTIYAAHDGAVAAPTAGLHFTPELFSRLDSAGIGRAFLTLHVGPGTFLPIKTEDTQAHRMHAESGVLDEETAASLNSARTAGARIVAVGTTALRLLEAATDADGVIRPFAGATDIFITPGYRFRAVDLLLTNFHLPKSTLFMLAAAFSGLPTMQAAYAHAIAHRYRFYSYGDASLLFPQSPP